MFDTLLLPEDGLFGTDDIESLYQHIHAVLFSHQETLFQQTEIAAPGVESSEIEKHQQSILECVAMNKVTDEISNDSA